MKVVRKTRSEFSLSHAEQLCSLWEEVWPSVNTAPLEVRVEQFLEGDLSDLRMQAGSERFHLVEEAGKILAVARSSVRHICFQASEVKQPVLALAGVCSSPTERGRGFGVGVVKDAFRRLGPEVPWSLFQTGVPAFYERLGARRVRNEFYNSYGEEPKASPWWDPYVMVRGVGGDWPVGRVDLCGAGY